MASRLVLLHKKPYLDFFYTQAPLLPYIYALWMKVAGVTWVSAKIFSALLTAILATLVCEEVWHETRNWLAGLSAAILFATSSLIFGFFPVVKTFSLAGLFLFAAYLLVSRTSVTSARWPMLLAGLLFGFSVSTRSYLVLVLPVLLWWVLQNTEPGARQTALLSFLGGFVLGIAPCLYFFAASPRAFLFNNLGYHALRSEGGLVGMWQQKFVALLQVFLLGPESNGIQTSLLFFISLAFLSSLPKRGSAARLAFQIAVVVGLVSLLPTPVHPQYFCLCIPFLLVTAVCVANDYLTELQPGRGKRLAAAGCVFLIGLYAAASVQDFRRYLVTGDGVAGVEPGLAQDCRLEHVLAVSKAINQVVHPGEAVASFWPGFIFQTKAVPFPGFENDFGLPVAEDLSAEQRARYHILSAGEIEGDFAAHRPRVVVLRDHILVPTPVKYREKVRRLEDTFRAALLQERYTRIRTVGDMSIYVYGAER
ncbi:MAG TPA: hypothetical protein VKV05_11455 [Terriglobales bacterium]|nr:hypothetical protein [Terriglobales bacterium]